MRGAVAEQWHTHGLDLRSDVVVKRFRSSARGEPQREWRALTLLARYAPGLAPAPVQAALAADPPVVVMSRLAGAPLRGTVTGDEQVKAMARAVATMHEAIPARLVADLPWVSTHPAVMVDRLRASFAEHPPATDPLVAQALKAGRRWLTHTHLTRSPRGLPAVFGHGDGNLANYLWDGAAIRVVDFEDSGRSDRAFELAEVVEHVSTWSDSHFDTQAFLEQFDLDREAASRLHECRRLNALAWLLILRRDDPAHPRNPPGTLQRQADRLLDRL
jgi:Ser/Thr protein kinase RdoA (MazF antagonist)